MALNLGLGLALTRNKGGSFYAGWGLAFDFVRGLYRVGVGNGASTSWLTQPGVSYARTGEQLSYNPVTGQWEVFAANVPAILTGAGQDIAEGTTNKCTNYNAAPDAVAVRIALTQGALTRVDDTAALRAAGLGPLIDAGKLSGLVWKVDNTAFGTTAYLTVDGATGNTNTHWNSCFIRGGSGAIRSTAGGAAGRLAFSSSAGYRRLGVAIAPTNSSITAQYEIDAGQVVYFILNQLEEKAYATNPVIVAGASASRGNAQPVVTGLSSILTPPFTLVAFANLTQYLSVGRDFAYVSDGSTANRFKPFVNAGGQVTTAVTAGGVGQGAVSSPAITGPRLVKTAIRVRTGAYSQFVDGVLIGTTSIPDPTGLNQTTLGTFIGASGEFLNSPLLFAGIAPDLTDAQLQALTASNGLLTDFL